MSEKTTLAKTEESTGLVRQNTRERLLSEIESLKEQMLVAREQEAIQKAREDFARLYVEFAQNEVGFDECRLTRLSREEREELAEILRGRAALRRRFLQAACLAVPSSLLALWTVFFSTVAPEPTNGSFFLLCAVLASTIGVVPATASILRSTTLCYFRSYARLKRLSGNAEFPHEAVEKLLEAKHGD